MKAIPSALIIAMAVISCGKKDQDPGTAEIVVTPTVASSASITSAFTPTFEVVVAPSDDEMEIEGAKIYYTTDGTEPSASSDSVEVVFTEPRDDAGKFNATSEGLPTVSET